jgi:hypothetical protein
MRAKNDTQPHLRGLEVLLPEVKGRRPPRCHGAGFMVFLEALGNGAQSAYEQLWNSMRISDRSISKSIFNYREKGKGRK